MEFSEPCFSSSDFLFIRGLWRDPTNQRTNQGFPNKGRWPQHPCKLQHPVEPPGRLISAAMSEIRPRTLPAIRPALAEPGKLRLTLVQGQANPQLVPSSAVIPESQKAAAGLGPGNKP
uniref:Uncharacterized protein n=1 Tax=Sphaerodactylus townsendi TaxID=933632 RepID=A0ACB8F4E9_9SAUR